MRQNLVVCIIEQDYRFIRKPAKQKLSVKSLNSAQIAIAGIEHIRIIQKGQIINSDDKANTFENFKMFMAGIAFKISVLYYLFTLFTDQVDQDKITTQYC
jgi:hypothetical protein